MANSMGKAPKVRSPKEVTNADSSSKKFNNGDDDAFKKNLTKPENMKQGFIFLHLESRAVL
jgi:hypothetical protein